MKPRIKLGEATLAGGGVMALYEHDGDFVINYQGREIMHSRANSSELLLGETGVAGREDVTNKRILIGGLGLGFTLRRVLELVGSGAEVEVVELVPEVVKWNETHLQPLHGNLLADPRVRVRVEDVRTVIRRSEAGRYDAILLDVDNGPVALVTEANRSLYSQTGLRHIHRTLKPAGRVVFWSAGPDPRFAARLKQNGFTVTETPAKVHGGARRAAYLLFVADRD
jgi:spermidine synthase